MALAEVAVLGSWLCPQEKPRAQLCVPASAWLSEAALLLLMGRGCLWVLGLRVIFHFLFHILEKKCAFLKKIIMYYIYL